MQSGALQPVYVRTQRLSGRPDPLALAAALGPRPGLFLRLSRGLRGQAAGWSYLALAEAAQPLTFRTGARLTDLLAPLHARAVLRHGPRVPFAGGWVGYLGYEARSAVERTPPPRRSPLGFPVLWIAPAPAVLAFDHRRGHVHVASIGSGAREARDAAARLLDEVAAARGKARGRRGGRLAGEDGGTGSPAPRPKIAAADYQAAVERVRRYVLDGDIFQANLSQRFDAQADADPLALFARLVQRQPTPHGTCLVLPAGRAVLSASPERFLAVRGRVATTEPMKGTRPRGKTAAEDRALRLELKASAKDQAELAMIVDLSRNDLARVATPGTVRVKAARRLIPFAGVHQAIAVVTGRLAPGKDRVDLLAAAFPPGSVTGAPKVRAMEVIDELEGEGRGPYCGAIGWFDVGGDMDLAVAIRTLLVAGTRASYRVGGGVTLRSDPVEEWRETLAKGAALSAALRGEP